MSGRPVGPSIARARFLTNLGPVWAGGDNLRLLVTSAASVIGRHVAHALADGNDLVLTDVPERVGANTAIEPSELGHGEETDDLVRGVEAVVHIGFGGQEGDATYLIDYHTRRTYNLYAACLNAGVTRAFYLSTLRLLDRYEHHLTVTERWKSLPDTEPEILSGHLGEYVTREFAREAPISTTVLRLGFPIVAGSRADADALGESAALATDDLALALRSALAVHLPKWKVLHVQSPVEGARFLMTDAESAIGFPAPVGEVAR